MQSKDVIYTVFQFMQPSEILKTCRTSPAFRDACNSEHLWKKLYTDKFVNTNAETISPSEFKKGLTYKKGFEMEIHRLKIRREIFNTYPNLLGMTAQFAQLMYHLYNQKPSEMHKFINKLILEQKAGLWGTTHEFLSLWQINKSVNLLSTLKKYGPILHNALISKKDEFIDLARHSLDSKDSDNTLLTLLNEKYAIYLPKTIKVYIRTQDNPILIDKYNIDRYKIILQIIENDISDIWESEWENHLKMADATVYRILNEVKKYTNK